jgi:para-aminobenzoate synthetase component 1
VLNWASQFDTFCFLDNHQYDSPLQTLECLLAAGAKREIKAQAGNALDQLDKFLAEKKSWVFGHLGYDLKNETGNFISSHPDGVGFPDLFFFEPEILIRFNKKEILIEADEPQHIYQSILSAPLSFQVTDTPSPVEIRNRISKSEYLSIIQSLREHILRGDCYEINFCQEFFAIKAERNPVIMYEKLSSLSPNPFSALYRVKDSWLVCASPERFLKKSGDKIISQPIKGTSKRIPGMESEDARSKQDLLASEKDRSENVMIVDLVRNDLSKICEEGSVKVDELYGIYSYPQVHQMISTISGVIKKDISFSEIIRATFPMGSMTGAPKKRVMELIEQYEKTKRGIFSGALGYIDPEGDFDFNVVIRSILYNAASRYLGFQAGSAITFYSDPEQEWEECMLKADAIRRVLKS